MPGQAGSVEHFTCRQCGECCRRYSINICYSDIDRWLEEGRVDILTEVAWIRSKTNPGKDDGFYFARTTLKEHEPCTFLNLEGRCDIYPTRPLACRDWPLGRKKLEADFCPALKTYQVDPKLNRQVARRQWKDFELAKEHREAIAALIGEVKTHGHIGLIRQRLRR